MTSQSFRNVLRTLYLFPLTWTTRIWNIGLVPNQTATPPHHPCRLPEFGKTKGNGNAQNPDAIPHLNPRWPICVILFDSIRIPHKILNNEHPENSAVATRYMHGWSRNKRGSSAGTCRSRVPTRLGSTARLSCSWSLVANLPSLIRSNPPGLLAVNITDLLPKVGTIADPAGIR